MVVRKPPRSKTNRKGRRRSAGALGDGIEVTSSSATEPIRARRNSAKAASSKATQVAEVTTPIPATEKRSSPATRGSKPDPYLGRLAGPAVNRPAATTLKKQEFPLTLERRTSFI